MPASDNYGLSVSRLRSLHYNLRKKPALLNEYDGIIQEQCKAGIVEWVPDEAPKDNEIQGIHFSPHHAVVRKDRETTKVRVVYDGSAKTIKNSRELRERITQAENVNQQAQSVQQSVGSMHEDDESYAKSTTGTISSASKESVVKVLGLNWNTLSDEFYFEYGELYDYAIKLPLSKRSVLKVTAKIFDPIGILIGMKILFQELCVKKLDWDGELHPDSHKVWKSYLSQIKHLSNIHIPRCYFSSLPSKIEFHAFSDASKLAYAAVVYVRTCYENGLIDVRLVASKSRVAPLKSQTIPCLELLGALILARLVDSLKRAGLECTEQRLGRTL